MDSGWGDEVVKVVSKVGEIIFTTAILTYILICWWNQIEPNELSWAGLGVFGVNFASKKLWELAKK